MRMRIMFGVCVLALLSGDALGQTAGMQGFQGLIKDANGDLVTDPVNLEFTIWDAENGGSQVDGPYVQNGIAPVAGVVSTKFGPVLPSVFDGNQRWLQVKVNGSPLSRIEMVTAPATAEQVNKPPTGTP